MAEASAGKKILVVAIIVALAAGLMWVIKAVRGGGAPKAPAATTSKG